MFVIPLSVCHTLFESFAQKVVTALFPRGVVITTPSGVSLTNRAVSMFEIIKLADGPCHEARHIALLSQMRHSKWRTSESPAANSGTRSRVDRRQLYLYFEPMLIQIQRGDHRSQGSCSVSR